MQGRYRKHSSLLVAMLQSPSAPPAPTTPTTPKNLDVSVSLIPTLIHDHMYFSDCINYVFLGGVMNAPPLVELWV